MSVLRNKEESAFQRGIKYSTQWTLNPDI